MFKNKLLQIIIFYTIILVLYIPLISKINFLQNDDFYYYEVVKQFQQGNFTLPDKIAPTFYLQGFLGVSWSYFFGIETLPFLTLLVSIVTAALFNLILVRNSKFTLIQTFLISSILFLNPFFQYSSLGFMTDNYLMFMLVGGIFFFYEYQKNPKILYLTLLILFSLGGFFIRQTALVLPAALALFFLINSKYKEGLIFVQVTIFIFVFYIFVFPLTPEMKSKSFEFENLFKLNYLYALILGILIYLGAFLFPFISFLSKITPKKFFILSALVFLIFWVSNYFYKPMEVAWGEFPFFENTFERTGFLPRELDGTKYYFRGNFDLYANWELLAKISMSLGLAILILNFKKLNLIKNFNFIFIGLYLSLLLLVEKFFDRYLLPLIVSTILLLIEYIKERQFTLLNYLVFICYFGLFSYFSYFLTHEFVIRNNLIWTKALVTKTNPENIKATRPWNSIYGFISEPEFIFSYDKPKIFLSKYKEYQLDSEYQINYLLNPFVDSKIYLYELNKN